MNILSLALSLFLVRLFFTLHNYFGRSVGHHQADSLQRLDIWHTHTHTHTYTHKLKHDTALFLFFMNIIALPLSPWRSFPLPSTFGARRRITDTDAPRASSPFGTKDPIVATLLSRGFVGMKGAAGESDRGTGEWRKCGRRGGIHSTGAGVFLSFFLYFLFAEVGGGRRQRLGQRRKRKRLRSIHAFSQTGLGLLDQGGGGRQRQK
jgi:hypothetical protein